MGYIMSFNNLETCFQSVTSSFTQKFVQLSNLLALDSVITYTYNTNDTTVPVYLVDIQLTSQAFYSTTSWCK